MKKEKKYKIIVSEKQLQVLSTACDAYSRLGTGQIDMALDASTLVNYAKPEINWNAIKPLCNTIKFLCTGLEQNASYGIACKETGEFSKIAYEMHGIFRHQIWKDNNGPTERRNVVSANEPLKVSKEPFLKIEKEK